MIARSKFRKCRPLVAAVLGLLLLAPTVAAADTLVAPEKNPPGDIPDNQAFITYKADAGFSLEVPEGWSRQELPNGARFSDKYGSIEAVSGMRMDAPEAASVKAREAADLEQQSGPVKIQTVKDVTLKSGPAVVISYLSNSAPNPVTNKRIRLEHRRYLIFNSGKLITLDLAAPAGADNLDQWDMMSNSVRWN